MSYNLQYSFYIKVRKSFKYFNLFIFSFSIKKIINYTIYINSFFL